MMIGQAQIPQPDHLQILRFILFYFFTNSLFLYFLYFFILFTNSSLIFHCPVGLYFIVGLY